VPARFRVRHRVVESPLRRRFSSASFFTQLREGVGQRREQIGRRQGDHAATGVSRLPNGDAALFVVNAVQPGSMSAPEIAAQAAEITRQAAGQVAAEEFSAYLAELERNAKVKRNPKLWE